MKKDQKIYKDTLTGVYNRRFLDIRVKRGAKKYIKTKQPFSVIMLDIDRFKEINDTRGHIKGDEVLKEFAVFLVDSLRDTDQVVRYGGDEFVCILPHTRRKNARFVFERLMQDCRNRKFAGLKITFSVGIASHPDDGLKFTQLIETADAALYEAKRQGRDRIGEITEIRATIPMEVFVDRLDERESLNDKAIGKRLKMRIVTVNGKVGIGKTRLIRETIRSIRNHEVIWADCLRLLDGITYYAIRELVKCRLKRQPVNVLNSIPVAYRVELAKLLPEILESIEEKVTDIDMVMDKYRLFEGIKRILSSGKQKKIIVIDNFQWVDRESTEVLRYLMRAVQDIKVTFILVFRKEEITDEVDDFLQSISRENDVVDIKIDPLNRHYVTECLRNILGDQPDVTLINYVVRESGGNPLYIEELMKRLIKDDYLHVEDQKWRFRMPLEELIPKSIEGIVMDKYKKLSTSAKRVVEIASILGWFDMEMIERILHHDDQKIYGILDELYRFGFTTEVRDRVVFSEEVSRDIICKQCVHGEQGMSLYHSVAKQLEQRYAGRAEEVTEKLAHYYYKAGVWSQAYVFCLQAGDRARDAYANMNAIRFYTWAYECVKQDRAHEQDLVKKRITCLIRRARVLNQTGQNDAAEYDYEQAIKLAQETHDVIEEAACVLAFTKVFQDTGRFKLQVTYAAKALDLYTALDNKEGMIKSMVNQANAHVYFGEIKEAGSLYRRALKMAKDTKNQEAVSSILGNLGVVEKTQGNHDTALKFYTESLKISKAIGNRMRQSACLVNMGVLYDTNNDYKSSLANYNQAYKIYEKLGARMYMAMVLNNTGSVYKNMSDYDNALKVFQQAYDMNKEAGNRHTEAIIINNIASVKRIHGDYATAVDLSQQAVNIMKDCGDLSYEMSFLMMLGEIYHEHGNFSKAMMFYESAMKISRKRQDRETQAQILIAMGNVLKDQTKFEEAGNCYKKAKALLHDDHTDTSIKLLLSYTQLYLEMENAVQAEEKAKQLIAQKTVTRSNMLKGYILSTLGHLYAKNKRWSKASTALQESKRLFSAINYIYGLGHVYQYQGEMYKSRRDTKRASRCLAKAVKLFTQLGVTWRLTRLKKIID
jgi:diguanylate cyclase (GGDEF)-like protein